MVDGSYYQVQISTKAFEGLIIGLKFSVVHGLFYSSFVSKEMSLHYGTNRIVEFLRYWPKVSLFFCTLPASYLAIRQHMYQNKDSLVHDLQASNNFLRNNYKIAEHIVFVTYGLPFALFISLWQRQMRVVPLYTMVSAIFLRAQDRQRFKTMNTV